MVNTDGGSDIFHKFCFSIFQVFSFYTKTTSLYVFWDCFIPCTHTRVVILILSFIELTAHIINGIQWTCSARYIVQHTILPYRTISARLQDWAVPFSVANSFCSMMKKIPNNLVSPLPVHSPNQGRTPISSQWTQKANIKQKANYP